MIACEWDIHPTIIHLEQSFMMSPAVMVWKSKLLLFTLATESYDISQLQLELQLEQSDGITAQYGRSVFRALHVSAHVMTSKQ